MVAWRATTAGWARRLSLSRRAARVELCVADDGVGMAPERAGAALADGHVGLASTRQRVEAAGGSFELRSSPGDGTTVRVTLPSVAPRGAVVRVPTASGPAATS